MTSCRSGVATRRSCIHKTEATLSLAARASTCERLRSWLAWLIPGFKFSIFKSLGSPNVSSPTFENARIWSRCCDSHLFSPVLPRFAGRSPVPRVHRSSPRRHPLESESRTGTVRPFTRRHPWQWGVEQASSGIFLDTTFGKGGRTGSVRCFP